MKKHLKVVAAIIKKDNKTFAAQRSNYGKLALKWEFPGGKVESNEKHEEALKREIKEELNANIMVIDHYLDVYYAYDSFNITLYSFICDVKDINEITLKEHVNSKWLTIDEIDSVD